MRVSLIFLSLWVVDIAAQAQATVKTLGLSAAETKMFETNNFKPYVWSEHGNTGAFKQIDTTFSLTENNAEYGTVVRTTGLTIGLKALLSSFEIQTAVVTPGAWRLKLYTERGGKPGKQFDTGEIIFHVTSTPGLITVDLKPYKIRVRGEIFVSISSADDTAKTFVVKAGGAGNPLVVKQGDVCTINKRIVPAFKFIGWSPSGSQSHTMRGRHVYGYPGKR